MIASLDKSLCNRFVDSLKQHMKEEQTTIDYLVIAPDDSRIVRSLESALSDQSIALLYSWQDASETEMEQIFAAVAWALSNLQVGNVALIGHSLSRGSDALGVPAEFGAYKTPRGSESSDSETSDSGYHRLVAGIQSSFAESARASESFARWVEQFCELPAVRSARESNKLEVHGLFYLAVSGSFSVYDLQQKTLKPLGR